MFAQRAERRLSNAPPLQAFPLAQLAFLIALIGLTAAIFGLLGGIFYIVSASLALAAAVGSASENRDSSRIENQKVSPSNTHYVKSKLLCSLVLFRAKNW